MKIIDKYIKKFKEQSLIMQIIEILFIMLVVYELITFQNLRIVEFVFAILVVIAFLQWFFKKE